MSINSIKVELSLSLSVQLFLAFLRNLLICFEVLIIFKAILEIRVQREPGLSADDMKDVFKSWVKFDPHFSGQMSIGSYIRFLFQLNRPLGVKDINGPHLKDRRNNQLFNVPCKEFFQMMRDISKFNVNVYAGRQRACARGSARVHNRRARVQNEGFRVHFVDYITLLCGSLVAHKTKITLQEYSSHRVELLFDIWRRIFKNYSIVEEYKKSCEQKDDEFKKKMSMEEIQQPVVTYDLINYLTINKLVFCIKNYINKTRFLKKQILLSSISKTHTTNHAQGFGQKSLQPQMNRMSNELYCSCRSQEIFRGLYPSQNEYTGVPFTSCNCKQFKSPPSELKKEDNLEKMKAALQTNYTIYSLKDNTQTKVVYVCPNFQN